MLYYCYCISNDLFTTRLFRVSNPKCLCVPCRSLRLLLMSFMIWWKGNELSLRLLAVFLDKCQGIFRESLQSNNKVPRIWVSVGTHLPVKPRAAEMWLCTCNNCAPKKLRKNPTCPNSYAVMCIRLVLRSCTQLKISCTRRGSPLHCSIGAWLHVRTLTTPVQVCAGNFCFVQLQINVLLHTMCVC